MKLTRSIERWAKCSPDVMSEMSIAAICFAFKDAKHYIAALTASHTALLAALEWVMENGRLSYARRLKNDPGDAAKLVSIRAAIKATKELG